MSEIVPFGAAGLVPHNMDEALRLAEFMARARTVPKHLQDSPGDCLMIIEQAMRWGMSPFAVAQATSVISGKMMFEGKLVAAAVENSGAIVGHIEYAFAGEGDARSITVSATRRGETNPRTITVTFKEARTGNEMWKRQPDQQLVYHGARVWARRWTPAVILGVYSREEMGAIIDGQILTDEPADAPVTPIRAAAAPMPRAARIAEQAPAYDTPRAEAPQPERKSWSQWADSLELAVRDTQSNEELGRLLSKAEVAEIHRLAQEGPRTAAKDRIIAAVRSAEERYLADPPEPSEDEVEISGAENVASG